MRVMMQGVSKRFHREPVLNSITWTIESAARWGLVGPSGAGKTTLLRMLSGLEQPTAGEMSWDESGRKLRPAAVGFVFQELGLWPHVTARDHIEYVLKGVSARARRDRAVELLTEVQLPAAAWTRRPGELSGGEAQRVALARALATQPTLFLLDEPFVQLHAALRAELCELVVQVVRQRQATLVCVTHAWSDLQVLCDQVAVLVEGRILQTGSLEEVFRQPHSAEVARLTGPHLSIPAHWLTAGYISLHRTNLLSDPNVACKDSTGASERMRSQVHAGIELTDGNWKPPRNSEGSLVVRPQQIVFHQPDQRNRWQVRRCQPGDSSWRIDLVLDTERTWQIPASQPIPVGAILGIGLVLIDSEM
jgi:iron(III) transport system ATP-binding protein